MYIIFYTFAPASEKRLSSKGFNLRKTLIVHIDSFYKNIMRFIKHLLLFSWVLSSIPMSAQRQHGVYAELLGASTSVGIHYDSRFNQNTRWGGRVGIAYTHSSDQDFFKSAPIKTTGYSFPIAVNYLIGNHKHNLELGIGLSYGIYSCDYNENGYNVERDHHASFGFLDIGYRFQAKNGLMIRAGVNPGTALGKYDELGRKENGVDRATVIYPYISIGYNF